MDSKSEAQVDKAIDRYREREERKRSIKLHNVPEPMSEDKKHEEKVKIREIFAVIKNEDIKPKTVVRLGQPRNNKPRLLKVVLDSVNSKNKFFGSTKWLRTKNGDGNIPHGWSNVFLTPDLTKEDRDKNKALRSELERKKHNENNPNLVIYRGQIVDGKIEEGGNKMGLETLWFPRLPQCFKVSHK